jgi:hypothetical protein
VRHSIVLLALAALSVSAPSQSQTYQPGTFSIDGIAARCGNIPIILDTSIPDVGQSGYGLIYLNPDYFEGLKTGLRLWWLAHECAHHVVGPDETAADCWSIRKGRDEGWFPREMFYWMNLMFADNRGDTEHPPGPQRVRNMQRCYNS